MVEIEDLIIKEESRRSTSRPKSEDPGVPERKKVFFVVMVESVDNLSCYQFHQADEVVTYYWVLDSISYGEVLETKAYKLSVSKD